MIAAQKIPTEDPRRTVLRKRCAELGWNPNRSNLIESASQMAGTDAGRAMVLGMDEDMARKSWTAFQGYSGAQERYHRRVLGRTMHPDSPRAEVGPEPFEVDAETEYDERSEDEKDRDACDEWQHWCDLMRGMSIECRADIEGVVRGWAKCCRQGEITPRGYAFLCAMRMLVEAAENS